MNGGAAMPNVGPGPDPLALRELEADFAVLLLHRDFYCSDCRQQVRRMKRRYEEFERRDTEVVSVLPEGRETAEEWQKQYHLPFPVVADAEKRWGERFDQPRKYGLLGRLHDVIGRMPATLVLDLRWSDPMETFAHRGESKTDRPRIDELLAAIDEAATLAADSTPEEREAAARAAFGEAGADPPETSVAPETGETPETTEAAEGAEAAEATEPHEAVEADEVDEAEEMAESGETPEPKEAVEPKETAESGETAETTVEQPTTDDAELLDTGTDVPDQPPGPTDVPLTVPEGVSLPSGVELRRADPDDAMPVIRVLHGALLEIDGETVRSAAERGDVFVAEDDGWVIGALVLEDNHIDALAIRRERRKQGLGSALVETAVEEIGGPVTADFRAGVREFWADLGFDIEREGARFYGIRR